MFRLSSTPVKNSFIKIILTSILLISSTLIFAGNNSTGSTDQEVRFIIFGDSQFANPPQFERMIHEAEMLRPNFVIQVGDLINGYTHDKEKLRREWKWFKNQISPLTCDYFPVPGNHDIVTDEAEEVYAEIWGADKYNYSFDRGSVHCIVLNSWHGEEDDRISEWQRDWLKEDLKTFAEKNGGIDSEQLQEKSIFVFLHSPLWKYDKDAKGRADWEVVHSILKEYPVKLVTAGHTHEYVWEERDGINYLVINSAGVHKRIEQAGMFSSFLNVSVLPGGDVKYAVIKAGSILPLDAVTPAERKTVSGLRVKEKTIQVEDWKPGIPLETEIVVPVRNNQNEKRIYNLTWDLPYGAELKIEPFSKYIEVEAGETVKTFFRLTSKKAPELSLMPSLKIETEKQLRSGFVSRKIEAKYKLQQSLELEKELISNVKLDVPVKFEAEFDLFVPPVLNVKQVKNQITVDGIFDEQDWQTAEAIEELNFRGGKQADVKTEIKILYDADYLYVAAKMEEPNIAGLKATAEGPIPFTWNDDDLELFFDTECSQKDYTRLFQNSAGTRFNSLQRWVPNKYFTSKYTSKIVFEEDAWFLEMQIPWSDIDLEEGPKSGNKWGFNIGRHRQQSSIKEMVWSGNLYQPQKYGVLRFE